MAWTSSLPSSQFCPLHDSATTCTLRRYSVGNGMKHWVIARRIYDMATVDLSFRARWMHGLLILISVVIDFLVPNHFCYFFSFRSSLVRGTLRSPNDLRECECWTKRRHRRCAGREATKCDIPFGRKQCHKDAIRCRTKWWKSYYFSRFVGRP